MNMGFPALLAQAGTTPEIVDSPVKLFQWILLPIFVILALLDAYRCLFYRPTLRRDRFVRFVVWLLASAAIYNPELTSMISQRLGITYGKDLLLYGFVIAFIVAVFSFYSWCLKTEQQITELARHIAHAEARRGSPENRPE